eukprot:6176863-Pleurochrysis_carterae.AAC.2
MHADARPFLHATRRRTKPSHVQMHAQAHARVCAQARRASICRTHGRLAARAHTRARAHERARARIPCILRRYEMISCRTGCVALVQVDVVKTRLMAQAGGGKTELKVGVCVRACVRA